MKSYKPYWIGAAICVVAAFLSPIIFTWSWYDRFSPNTGFIGDTVGGLTAPMLSIAGSILVFAALKAQIEANKVVQEQFKQQQKESEKRDFEQKLFRLFDLHLSTVNTFNIASNDIQLTNYDADFSSQRSLESSMVYQLRNWSMIILFSLE